jgi:hypothetical protein
MIPDGLFARTDVSVRLFLDCDETFNSKGKGGVWVERSERSRCVGFFGILHCVQDDSKDLCLARLSCGSIEFGWGFACGRFL